MIDFLRHRWLYFLISTFVIGAGLFSIFRWGFIYSIDFVGGTNLQYQAQRAIPEKELEKFLGHQNIQIIHLVVDTNAVTIRTKPIDEKKESEIRTSLGKEFKTKITTLRFETVGPAIGQEAIQKTVIASLIAIVGILVYMTFTFKRFNFALSAIIALFHDLLVMIGGYSLMSHFAGAQVDTLFVTAVLTTMSFSVHDTIVIFDKIREHVKHYGTQNLEEHANQALTQTLVRSLNNSMTIVFMLLALTLLGGSTIRFFVVALLIGTLTGTYSSPFIATPILVWLEGRKRK